MANTIMGRNIKVYNLLKDSDFDSDPNLFLTTTSHQWDYNSTFYSASDSILAPVIARIAIDVAAIPIRHVLVDENGMFVKNIRSELGDRFRYAANMDQAGASFVRDIVHTTLENGHSVIVPVESSKDMNETSSYDVYQLRVGTIIKWETYTVIVSVYDQDLGKRVYKRLPKALVSIVPNPLFGVMNKFNSTLKRLIEKLAISDMADKEAHAPGLDLIVQLPYPVKREKRQQEAEDRVAQLTAQLNESTLGVGYIDSSEHVIPLNRRVENTLRETIQILKDELHGELGITPDVFMGTADEKEMLMYYNRTVYPIIEAITSSMRVTFFSKSALTRGHDLMAFPQIFKMAALSEVAEATDKFTRNAVFSSNEIRGFLGVQRSDDPSANELRNKNINTDSAPPTDEQAKSVENPDDKEA